MLGKRFSRMDTVVLCTRLLVLGTFWILCAPACHATQNNPVYGAVSEPVLDSTGVEQWVIFDATYWCAYFSGWDGVYTNNNGVEFDHLYVQSTDGTAEDWPMGGYTAGDAKRFFDSKWAAYRSGEPSSGTATARYNCFSYATGRTQYWVNSDAEIVANDYTSANCCPGATIGDWWENHMVIVAGWAVYTYHWTDCGGYHSGSPINYISEIKMKDGGSAFFDYYYSFNTTTNTGWDQTLPPYYPLPCCLGKPK